MRAVILPATPLLLPWLVPGLSVDPLADVREAVRAALAELTAGGRVPLVLAGGRTLRHGLLRPSLARSGIADRWLPSATGGPTGTGRQAPERQAAGTAASVALLALAMATGATLGRRDVETLELPSDAADLDQRTVELLCAADGLVVAGGATPDGPDSGPGTGADLSTDREPTELTAGLRAALRAAGGAAWRAEVQVFEQTHDQLPPEYRVTVLS